MADTKQKKNPRLHEPKTPTTLEKFNLPKAEIQKILKDTENLVIIDTDTYKGVKGARLRVQKTLTAIETKRKDLKAPILAEAKQVDVIAKELSDSLGARKLELASTIKTYEDKLAEQKAEKERLKALRLKVIRDTIKEWKTGFEYDPKITVADLQANIQAIRDKVFPKKEFEELVPEAEMERGVLLGQLGNILALREEAERKEAEAEAEKVKLENERLAQELAYAKEQYNNVFGHYPEPDDLTLEQIQSIVAKRIREMRANTAPIAKVPGKMTTPIEVSGDHEKEIAVKGTSSDAGKKAADVYKTEVADKKAIKEKLAYFIAENIPVIDGKLDVSLDSPFWSSMYSNWHHGIMKLIEERAMEMLEQVQ